MGMYAPNDNKYIFYKVDRLQAMNYEQCMLLGNFNGVLEPKWDRSNCSAKNNKRKLSKTF